MIPQEISEWLFCLVSVCETYQKGKEKKRIENLLLVNRVLIQGAHSVVDFFIKIY